MVDHRAEQDPYPDLVSTEFEAYPNWHTPCGIFLALSCWKEILYGEFGSQQQNVFFTINLNTVSDPSLSWSQFNHKNIRRHTAYAIVSWPDPKQCMFNSSYFRYDDDNKTKYIFSQSSQGKWTNWKHTASYSVQWITEKMCPILHTRQNISDTLLKRIPCRGLTGRDNSRSSRAFLLYIPFFSTRDLTYWNHNWWWHRHGGVSDWRKEELRWKRLLNRSLVDIGQRGMWGRISVLLSMAN